MTKKIICTILVLLILIPFIPFGALKVSAAVSVPLDTIIKAASDVIRVNEGNYNSVNANDNGALSIGWIQWHGNRALSLLRTIVAANEKNAKTLLGDTLYNEVKTASSWSARILTKNEASKISALISTDEGKKAQDELAAKDIANYINRAIGYGITDPSALVYYADVENQCGAGGAKPTAEAAAKLAGSYDKVTLDIIYKAALADKIAGKYATRRSFTYNNCLLLEWNISSSDLEVWDILSVRNVRSEPSTSSEKITSIAAGTKVVIREKATFEGATRGRTQMGWITIDDGSCALNEELTGSYVPAPIIFDTNGGNFGTTPKSTYIATGINISRPSNSLIVYNGNYGKAYPSTNQWGTEVAVDADGKVLNAPKYGLCKTEIPAGGMVLSGIGTGYSFLAENIAVGNYISFNEETLTIVVYNSRDDLKSSEKASTTALDVNTARPSNSIIIYDSDYKSAVTPTNQWGTEVAVDSTGKVLNNPLYGTCKTAIPKDGYVISGIGTGYNWLYQNVKAGNYIHIDTDSKKINVYSNKNAYLLSCSATIMGEPFGVLPSPELDGYVFAGWILDGEAVNSSTVCESPFCVTLKAKWKESQAGTVTYDLNGGYFTGTASALVNGINVSRPQNSIIIYDNGYGSSRPSTNEYGAEAAVDADGIVISNPTYGTCKTEIPEGGFVISGIGTGYHWLSQNVKAGKYVVFDKGDNSLTVYESREAYEAIYKSVYPGKPIGTLPTPKKDYHAFEGWFTPAGEKITSTTVMPVTSLILVAKWKLIPGKLSFNTDGGSLHGLIAKATAAGTNVSRGANALVIYKDRASTKTNVYGTEAIIDKNGTVLFVFPYGVGNTTIPAGCTVLSGNGSMSTWIRNNLTAGRYVHISNNEVTVWYDLNAYNASKNDSELIYGESFGPLPTAEKKGYTFLGWKDKNSNYVTAETVISAYGDITLTADFEKLCAVTFNAEGAKLSFASATASAKGVNISRGANQLIIYTGNASTKTNVYGSEAVISADGRVIAVYPYGKGNASIPEGCIVLSGNGSMSSWIQQNIRAGKYVKTNGYTVSVYEDHSAFTASGSTIYVKSGSALASLPSAAASDKALKGWYLEDIPYNTTTVIKEDITLQAKWTKLSATLTFNTNGGKLGGKIAETSVNGINTSRPSNSLVIYDNSYKYSAPQTNAFGAEAAVGADGIVITNPVYGTCKTPIPKDGFVLSGIGTGYSWLSKNVKIGSYVHIDKANMTVSVYDSYADYLASGTKTIYTGKAYGPLPTAKRDGYVFEGWKDINGKIVAENTVVANCDAPVLTAVWAKYSEVTFDTNGGYFKGKRGETTLNGINTSRGSNALIIYDGNYKYSAPQTNVYGTEIAVNNEGIVITKPLYGTCKTPIPENGFVLSGIGTGYNWLIKNTGLDNYIVFDKAKMTVTSYYSYGDYIAETGKTVCEGRIYSTLPVPQRDGYRFAGWTDSRGNKINEDTVVSQAGDHTLTATWVKLY